MNLRELAAADHRLLVEDVADGFGRELTFVDPKGTTGTVNGYWNNIGQAIDLQSGTLVAGTVAFVRVTLGALAENGFGIPEAIADKTRKAWTVSFQDMAGRRHDYKINEVRVDRSVNAVDCYLENYQR